MPESVDDRPTKAHEYVFLLSRSARYYYDRDAIAEAHTDRRTSKSGKNALRGQASLRPTDTDDSTDRWYAEGGRNARTVWSIATTPFKDAHFATFPPEIPRRAILAGTSLSTCAACGAPHQRVVESVRTLDGEPWEDAPAMRNADIAAPSTVQGVGHWRTATSRRTVEWAPTCACGTAETKPSLVLDPFAGSGTTGVVASGFGRSFVGFELNPRYAEMARGRIARDGAGLFAREAP